MNSGPSSSPPPPPPPTPADFALSVSSSSQQIARGSSGSVQVMVTATGGFSGSVTVTPANLPTGITSDPITVAAGSAGTLSIDVSSMAATGPFNISLNGTSGNLSHSTSVAVTVPFGGGVLTINPTTSEPFAIPQNVAAYLSSLEADVAPVRTKICGSESSTLAFAMQHNPQDSTSTHTQNSDHYINLQTLPSVPADGTKNYTDYSVYETAHALQYDLLHNAGHRATQADIEGFSETCSDLVYQSLASNGGNALKGGGSLEMLWFDNIRRADPETVSAGSWSDPAHFQPEMAIGEGSLLLAFTQKLSDGTNGLVAHENAIFDAEFATYTASPLTADDRIRAWDSTGIMLDGQSAGQWMPVEMIQDSNFTQDTPHLIAWPVNPQFPAQMMAQALVVKATTPSDDPTEPGGIPTVEPIASGPLTITCGTRKGM
jgi:hypothetical protein